MLDEYLLSELMKGFAETSSSMILMDIISIHNI